MNGEPTQSTGKLIRVLPPELSNKIAAGEVVERPAAVIKELLDNAIDSGTDEIKVLVRNAGRSLIQISDNGCGIAREDIPLVFERHATSKISSVEDLFNIHTLGFRGEAMASIAAVAQVSLKSKLHDEDSGWEVEIWGGEDRGLNPVGMESGTTVSVRNLFYNVPARRAFLKTDATELRHIIIAVQQAALAHPEIAFEFSDGQETIYKLSAASLAGRIADIFGKPYRASLIPVEEQTSIVSVRGYIIDPKMCKKNRGEQFLFVNNRPFMHRHIHYIIKDVYKTWTTPEQYPFYALFFEVEPSKVDVNVHPTKLEVKFDDERSIASFVRSIIKRALNERFNVPALEPDGDINGDTFDRKAFTSGFSFSKPDTGPRSFIAPESRFPDRDYRASGRDFGDELYNLRVPSDAGSKKEVPMPGKKAGYDKIRGFWQLHDEYVISQTRTGMFIIDQHAAHKRIIFEKALQSAESGLPGTQQLLFPQTIDFSASDFAVLKEVLPTLKKIGFNIQLLSGNSALVSGVPSDLTLGDERPVIESILHQYQHYSGPVKLEKNEKLAAAYASKAAIPRGKKLSQAEMEALIDQLFSCENPYFDPLNKPTTVFITLDDIHRRFKKH